MTKKLTPIAAPTATEVLLDADESWAFVTPPVQPGASKEAMGTTQFLSTISDIPWTLTAVAFVLTQSFKYPTRSESELPLRVMLKSSKQDMFV